MSAPQRYVNRYIHMKIVMIKYRILKIFWAFFEYAHRQTEQADSPAPRSRFSLTHPRAARRRTFVSAQNLWFEAQWCFENFLYNKKSSKKQIKERTKANRLLNTIGSGLFLAHRWVIITRDHSLPQEVSISLSTTTTTTTTSSRTTPPTDDPPSSNS